MRFEPGEKIRVMNRIGRQTEETLNYANFVQHSDNPQLLIVEILGKEYEVHNTKCYKWSPAPDDDEVMGEWALERIPEIVKFIEGGLKSLLNVENVVSTESNNDQGIPHIIIDGMTVTVEPCRIIRKCIGRIVESFGWSCTTYRVINNYPVAPDDVEDIEYGTEPNTLAIAQMAVKAYSEILANNYWQHVSECQMAEELQAEGLIK